MNGVCLEGIFAPQTTQKVAEQNYWKRARHQDAIIIVSVQGFNKKHTHTPCICAKSKNIIAQLCINIDIDRYYKRLTTLYIHINRHHHHHCA